MIEQTAESQLADIEELAPIERATIEVLKSRGASKGVRRATLSIMQTGKSEKYGTVRLACTPQGNIWYVVTELPVEGSVAPAPLRHEREAMKLFAALCKAE